MQFYVLDVPFATAAATTYAGGQWVNWTGGGSTICPHCGMPTSQSEPAEYQIELSYLGRKGFVEVLWNSHAFTMVRSDVIDLWWLNGFTGFETRPVRIIGWRLRKSPLPKRIPKYFRVIATGRAGLLSPPTRSVCPVCGYRRYDFELKAGIRVDESTWDQTDIFSPRGYDLILCTRRVAEVTLRAGYHQIVFVRAEEWNTWSSAKEAKQHSIHNVEDLD